MKKFRPVDAKEIAKNRRDYRFDIRSAAHPSVPGGYHIPTEEMVEVIGNRDELYKFPMILGIDEVEEYPELKDLWEAGYDIVVTDSECSNVCFATMAHGKNRYYVKNPQGETIFDDWTEDVHMFIEELIDSGTFEEPMTLELYTSDFDKDSKKAVLSSLGIDEDFSGSIILKVQSFETEEDESGVSFVAKDDVTSNGLKSIEFQMHMGSKLIGKATLIKNAQMAELRGTSFMIQDIYGIGVDYLGHTLSIAELYHFEVFGDDEERHAKFLKEILNGYVDRSEVLLVKAEPLYPSLAEFKASTNHFERLEELVDFYYDNGFTNINDLVVYENATAMMYTPTADHPVWNAYQAWQKKNEEFIQRGKEIYGKA